MHLQTATVLITVKGSVSSLPTVGWSSDRRPDRHSP